MSIIDYSWDFSKEEFSLDLDFFNEKEQEDKLWQARTGLNLESLCGTVETIIFMQDRPISIQKIKNHIDPDIPLRVIHDAIVRLQEEYEATHHGIRLMEVAQGYQFRSKATYAKMVQKVLKVETLQLSPTAIEVLAIIAYRQPISKTDVEDIRGVDSSHIIRALMDRRLVKITGRSEEMGRPSLYGTTPEFLEVFNLADINQLPSESELEEIAHANEVGEIADIKTIVQTGDKAKFDFDELEELDKLSESIQLINSETLFTQSLKHMDRKRTTEDGEQKLSAFDILEDYVNRSEVADQNTVAKASELFSNLQEPKAVTLGQLQDQLLNAPDQEIFEEMDTPEMQEMRDQAQLMLEKSEQLLADLLDGPANMMAAHNKLESEEEVLARELDRAFDNLMASTETTVEEPLPDLPVELSDELLEDEISLSDN